MSPSSGPGKTQTIILENDTFFFFYIYIFIHIYNKFLCTIYFSFVKEQNERESFDCKQCFILKEGGQKGKVLIKLVSCVYFLPVIVL